MKSPSLLISASLLLNAGLVSAFIIKPDLAPASIRMFFQSHSTVGSAAQLTDKSGKASSDRSRLWSEIDAKDVRTWAANLKAAGFSASTIRSMVMMRMQEDYAMKVRALAASQRDIPFWKSDRSSPAAMQKLLTQVSEVSRARSRELRELVRDGVLDNDSIRSDLLETRQFGNISGAKVDLIRHINEDYRDMIAEVKGSMAGITLPEDSDKLALLEREREADLAEALTPSELQDYEAHTSRTANHLRPSMALMNATEEEYRTIYRVEAPYASQLFDTQGVPGADAALQRQEAMATIRSELQNVLGQDRYNDFNRASNPEFQQLSRIAQSANLDRAATRQAFDLRTNASQESTRIFDDQTLSDEQKQTALQQLATTTRQQLMTTLGPIAGQAYLSTASHWLTPLSNGAAFTVNEGYAVSHIKFIPRQSMTVGTH